MGKSWGQASSLDYKDHQPLPTYKDCLENILTSKMNEIFLVFFILFSPDIEFSARGVSCISLLLTDSDWWSCVCSPESQLFTNFISISAFKLQSFKPISQLTRSAPCNIEENDLTISSLINSTEKRVVGRTLSVTDIRWVRSKEIISHLWYFSHDYWSPQRHQVNFGWSLHLESDQKTRTKYAITLQMT